MEFKGTISKTILIFSVLLVFLITGYSYSRFKDKKLLEKKAAAEKVFEGFVREKKKLPTKEDEVSLIAVGDVSYSRGVEREVKKHKDINYPFLKIGDYLKGGDIVFGNLETPITPGSEIPSFVMIFRSNPGTEKALKRFGFTIMSLANNHTPNFGQKGLRDTFYYLDSVGIKYVGAGEDDRRAYSPVFINKNGIKFSFLAYNDSDVVPDFYKADKNRAGTAFMDIKRMSETINKVRAKVDFVIVSMHSGIEYVNTPNTSQIRFAHAAVDSGADLIIGHHPHVIQIMEKYKGKYIFYSLGNFIFDQPQMLQTREGLAVKIYFSKAGIKKISFLPVFREKMAQPRVANLSESERILKRLAYPLATQEAYVWDKESNSFRKTLRRVIYVNKEKGEAYSIKQRQTDLDNDSVFEDYVLKDGKLIIKEGNRMIWQSPGDWWIDDFSLADLNNDGIDDINLSLWKVNDDLTVKNYFFILNFIHSKIKHVWNSSPFVNPICQFKIADVDGDGENELVVIEGQYNQLVQCLGRRIGVWKWEGLGLLNIWRSKENNFSNIEVESIGGRGYILYDKYN